MKKKKLFSLITTLTLALVLFLTPCLIKINETSQTVRTTSIEITRQEVDYQSVLDEFENAALETEGSLTTFVGYKSINITELNGLDLVSETDVDKNTEVSVKYNFSYDSETNIVTLSAELIDELGEIQIDTITGIAFINEYGEIDAVMNIDGEGILLSEMKDAGLIANCGWFSKLIKKVVKAVAVVAAVVAAVAVTAAVVIATAGAAAPAVVAAGVGITAGTSLATTAIASTCLTVAMVAAGISLASTLVAELNFEGVNYKLEEYSKVAKELLKGFYYLAIGDSEGRMLISPIRLPSVALASLAMKTGLSVYSPDSLEAYAAAQLAGDGLAPVLDPAHKDGYFAHYHAFGRPRPSSHAFYGVPTTKGSYL
ncbi:MAG: hypothetical protein J6T74_08020 [Clostridia bacterium]|nr:hypothetical protein [Clostridia bacterium]